MMIWPDPSFCLVFCFVVDWSPKHNKQGTSELKSPAEFFEDVLGVFPEACEVSSIYFRT